MEKPFSSPGTVKFAKVRRQLYHRPLCSRTHSFDDSNPRLARQGGGGGRKGAGHSRRVSWHSGLDMVDSLGVLGSAIRPGQHQPEVRPELLETISF